MPNEDTGGMCNDGSFACIDPEAACVDDDITVDMVENCGDARFIGDGECQDDNNKEACGTSFFVELWPRPSPLVLPI